MQWNYGIKVKISWKVMPCQWMSSSWCSQGSQCLHVLGRAVPKFPIDTASHPRRLESPATLLWEPTISKYAMLYQFTWTCWNRVGSLWDGWWDCHLMGCLLKLALLNGPTCKRCEGPAVHTLRDCSVIAEFILYTRYLSIPGQEDILLKFIMFAAYFT